MMRLLRMAFPFLFPSRDYVLKLEDYPKKTEQTKQIENPKEVEKIDHDLIKIVCTENWVCGYVVKFYHNEKKMFTDEIVTGLGIAHKLDDLMRVLFQENFRSNNYNIRERLISHANLEMNFQEFAIINGKKVSLSLVFK